MTLQNLSSPGCMLCILALLGVSGCVSYERARLPDDRRFDLLHAGELSAFEQRLAAENQTGIDDDWTRLGEAWVALANCQDMDAAALNAPDADPLVKLLHASLVLEEIRRKRLITHRATKFVPTSISNTIFDPLDDPKLFERKAPALPDKVVVWPEAEEAWADELPGFVAQPLKCQELYQKLFIKGRKERRAYNKIQKKWREARRLPDVDVVDVPPPRYRLQVSVDQLELWYTAREDQAQAEQAITKQAPSPPMAVDVTEQRADREDRFLVIKDEPPADPTLEPAKPDTLAMLELEEIIQAEYVLELGESLPADVRSNPSVDALLWRVRFHLVFFAGEHLRQLSAISRPSPREAELQMAWLERRRQWSAPLATRELEHAPISEQILKTWRIAPLLDFALHAEQEQRWSEALAAYRRIEEIGVSARNAWSAKYLHVRLLSRLGKWDDMARFLDELPPKSSRLYAPYLWHVSRALFATGEYDRFLGLAMDAMRDRPYESDPFMRAVYMKALASLTQVPFESRTVELLEDMGPRSTTFERVEAYAAVSLDRGKPENARAAALWLLGKHLNANYHPRYHAVLALAAFLDDDLEAFEAALDDVVARPEALVEAIGAGRRGSFFVNADEQLARVFREMLPVMAEWGDGKQADALRQKWLEVITLRAQSFLQNSPESLARPALVELYRIASSMLESSTPRAYPERVGALEPSPLVLGTVRVGERELAPFEPAIQTYHEAVPSLTLIPRDQLPVSEWIEWFQPILRDEKPEDAPGEEVVK